MGGEDSTLQQTKNEGRLWFGGVGGMLLVPLICGEKEI